MKFTFQDFLQFLNRSGQPILSRESASLASQMSHRPSTQDAYYMVHQKKKESVVVSRLIQHVMQKQVNRVIIVIRTDLNISNTFQTKSKFIKIVFFENQNEFSVFLPLL